MAIIICILSSLILLEAREIYQGMLSMPMVTSLFLILLGLPAKPIFLTAILVQLHFANAVPAGAVKFPEYQYAFFITTGLILNKFQTLFNDLDYFLIILLFFLTVFFSRIVAQVVYLKRLYLGYYFQEHKVLELKTIKEIAYRAFTISFATAILLGLLLTGIIEYLGHIIKTSEFHLIINNLKNKKEIFNLSFFTLFLYEILKFLLYKKERWPFIIGVILVLLSFIIYAIKHNGW